MAPHSYGHGYEPHHHVHQPYYKASYHGYNGYSHPHYGHYEHGHHYENGHHYDYKHGYHPGKKCQENIIW